MNWPYLGLRDPISAGTHLAALVLALVAAALLWRKARGSWRLRLPTACFCAGMVLLYGASATYHAVRLAPDELRVFRLLDHSAIYVLIAASFTPPVVHLLPAGRRRAGILGGIWCLGLAGVAAQWLLPTQPYGLELSTYVGMGWLGVLLLGDVMRSVGLRGLMWVAGGGLLYTLGGLADLFQWPVLYPQVFGPHEVFHVLAMGGTSCHVVFVAHHVLPYGIQRYALTATTSSHGGAGSASSAIEASLSRTSSGSGTRGS